jgi:nucleotide-binding universal stress UspA family protein
VFENVLVGVDGSSGGRDAIALAQTLAGARARLTLAHVHAGELRPTHALAPGLVREERVASERLLEAERAAAGVSAELVSVVALGVGAGLHGQAEASGAELIVVGSCSRGVLGRAMLGDDTRAALNGAPCAVAIAAAGYAQRATAPSRLGVGYDGSAQSRLALALARELAGALHARIEALQVVAIPSVTYSGVMMPSIAEGMDATLDDASARMSELPGVEGHAVYGLAGEELAAFSANVDLLLVGSRGYGPLRRLVLGSASNYLERHARCSLLVLPRALGGAEQAREQLAGGAGALAG